MLQNLFSIWPIIWSMIDHLLKDVFEILRSRHLAVDLPKVFLALECKFFVVGIIWQGPPKWLEFHS